MDPLEPRQGGADPWRQDAVLEGSLVRLEPLSPDHLAGLCAVGLDPALWELALSDIDGPEAMRRYLDTALAERARGASLPFAQVERASGRVVGSTRLGSLEPRHRRAEIGWTWLAAPWQRTGINAEAKLLLLAHAFDVLGCVRVELKTDARNARSRAAILRLGAMEEGTLRRHMITERGHMRDSVYFSVLADEWPAVRAGLAARLARRPAAP
ncbi:MAG TPA: GNAT family protein [Gemmatirosa sp.]|nr:GNAT family protein [Gemmatirosa sp.]